jgi:hypothetical protein
MVIRHITAGRMSVRADRSIDYGLGGWLPGSGPCSPWAANEPGIWKPLHDGIAITGGPMTKAVLKDGSLTGTSGLVVRHSSTHTSPITVTDCRDRAPRSHDDVGGDPVMRRSTTA